jgi:hypothetical protein
VLNPGTSNIVAGSPTAVSIRSNVGTSKVDGFQIFVNVTGTLPTDLTFTGSDLKAQGLNMAKGDIVDNGTTRTVRILFITTNPDQPFTASGDVILGNLKFTAPQTGNLTLTVDAALTKIVDHDSGSNLAVVPSPTIYTFVPPIGSDPGTSSSSSSSSSSTVSSSSSSVSSTVSSSSTSSEESSSSSSVSSSSSTPSSTSSSSSSVPSSTSSSVSSSSSSSVPSSTSSSSSVSSSSSSSHTSSVSSSSSSSKPHGTDNAAWRRYINLINFILRWIKRH